MRRSDEERGCYTTALRLITISDLQMGLRERLERNIWNTLSFIFSVYGSIFKSKLTLEYGTDTTESYQSCTLYYFLIA